MGTLLQRLDENDYKGDLELLDRYVGFSSEIVRVSLLGLAAVGFVLKAYLPKGELPDPPTLVSTWFFALLGFAALVLALAVAFGLLHRYYATDGLASHLKALRLSVDADPLKQAKAPGEASLGTNRFRLSRGWLVSAECAVACGVVILGSAFAVRFGIFDKDSRWKVAMPLAFSAAAIAFVVAAATWRKILRHKPSDSHSATNPAGAKADREQ